MKPFALLLIAATAALAGPSGVVVNRTTGKPEPRVPVTLISFAEGMDPIEEIYTDANGRFELAKDVAGMGMLRIEHQGVSYSHMLRPGAMADVEVEIYEATDSPVEPTGRVVVLEPGQAEMVVNESYLYENNTQTTFRDADNGSLRFYLPPEAKGIVQVEASGPARMPLQATAEKTETTDIYKVDFPIKPGENRISLTYLVPHTGGKSQYVGRSPYENIQTRVAVPQGVSVDGEDLQSFGTEPSTQAVIYEVPNGHDFRLTVEGSGKLARSESAGAEAASASPEISIEPAPVAKESVWIFGIAGAVLAIGFLYLLGARKE